MDLIVEGKGVFIGKHLGRIRVRPLPYTIQVGIQGHQQEEDRETRRLPANHAAATVQRGVAARSLCPSHRDHATDL